MNQTQASTVMIMLTEAGLQRIIEQALTSTNEKIERLEKLLSGVGEVYPLTEFVSSKVAAEMLKVQVRTVLQYQNDGKLKSFKTDGLKSHQFKRVDVLQLAKRL